MNQFWIKEKDIQKNWWQIDANNQTTGRLSSIISILLRGKHKASYTPGMDCGDYVVVINAEKIKFTGNKWNQKTYLSYSNYPGGQKSIKAGALLKKHPTQILEKAIKGMLPKNTLSNKVYKNLFVYQGDQHPHQAQKPKTYTIA